MSNIKAEYIDHMGSDLTVVNAARVSFDKESEFKGFNCNDCQNTVQNCCTDHCSCIEVGAKPYKQLSSADTRLLQYLATHDHFTPFTHPMITLRETVPIFVARQRFKHVVGFTYNEVSRRYVDDEPEFYVPDVWRSRPEGSAKQGSGDRVISEPISVYTEGHESNFGDWEMDSLNYEDLVHLCKAWYKEAIKQGVAPEQARMVLPQSMMTSYYTTGSLAAFARMVTQRKDSHAQKEIQDLAKEIDKTIRPLFPVSWQVLVGDVWYE